jgi:hypothetical protein
MFKKIVISGAAAAFIAVAGLATVSAPAEAGVRVHIGVPGFYGYWGPGFYPSYPALYGGHYGGYYAQPYYGGYYGNAYYGGHRHKTKCGNVVKYKKVWTQNHGWVKKKVFRKRCW